VEFHAGHCEDKLESFGNVFNRLYAHATDLSTKKEMQSRISEFIEKRQTDSLSHPKVNHNANLSFDSYRKPGESVETALYRDSQQRHKRIHTLITNTEREVSAEINKSRINQNAHLLALHKLEKSLSKLINHFSEGRTAVKKAEFSEMLMHFEVAKHLQKADNINEKQRERKQFEEEMIDRIWELICFRVGHSEAVESEFVLQLFKIIFDPYTPWEAQIQLVLELRKIIKMIFQMANKEYLDRTLKACGGTNEALWKRVGSTLALFRSLNSNFYDLSHLSKRVAMLE